MKLSLESLRQLISEAVEKNPQVTMVLENPELLDEKSILKNKHPFKALYIFGPAGAGKSFLSKQIGVPTDFVVSNPDERIESVFPAFGMSMKYASAAEGEQPSELEKVQQMSRKVLQNAEQGNTANMLAIANPIVFDTTGEDVGKLVSRMKALMDIGYDIAVFMVNVPTDVSVDRDKKRARTVGEPTKTISQDYQKEVVKSRGYFEKLAGLKYATILGGDIYANLYDLRDNSLLPGITDDHVSAMKTRSGDTFTPEYAANLLGQTKSDLKSWLTAEPINPAGKLVLRGMRKLVKVSGGKKGQNMIDLTAAMADPELAADPEISQAANHLAKLGGADAALGKAQRKKKNVGDTSIRGLSRDSGIGSADRDKSSDDARMKDGKKKFEESKLTSAIEDVIIEMLKEA
jgi:hypothetical protein